MSDKEYRQRQEDMDAARKKIAGAKQYLHPTRGWVYLLADGTILTKPEYQALQRKCSGLWWLFGRA